MGIRFTTLELYLRGVHFFYPLDIKIQNILNNKSNTYIQKIVDTIDSFLISKYAEAYFSYAENQLKPKKSELEDIKIFFY